MSKADQANASSESSAGEALPEPSTEPDHVPDETSPSSHYATFTIELLMNAKTVRRTRITHVQTSQHWSWAGWDEEQMLGTIARATSLRRLRSSSTPNKPTRRRKPNVAPALASEAVPLVVSPAVENAAPITITGALVTPIKSTPIQVSVQHGQVIADGSTTPTQVLMNQQAFRIRMGLDMLPQQNTSGPYFFHAVMQAKALADGSRAIVCERDGDVVTNNDGSVSIEFDGAALAPGTYRLTATVALQPADANPRSKHVTPTSATWVEGMLLHVY